MIGFSASSHGILLCAISEIGVRARIAIHLITFIVTFSNADRLPFPGLLVADDDPFVVRLCQRALESHYYRVLKATSNINRPTSRAARCPQCPRSSCRACLYARAQSPPC